MLIKFVRFFAARASLTVALWAIAVGFGALAYARLMPREGFPAVEVPVTVMSGTYFVDDQEQVDREVTVPLVEALVGGEGVDAVNSSSRNGSFSIVVHLDDGRSTDDGVALFEQAVAAVDLPADATYRIERVNASKFFNRYDLLVAVNGPTGASAAELEAAADGLVPVLAGDPGIESAEVVSLFRRGTNPATGQEVAEQSGYSQISVGGSGDGAGPTGAGTVSSGGGELRPSVSVGVVAAPGVDALGVRDATDAALVRAVDDGVLPDGYGAEVAIDFATAIRQQIGSLQSNVLTGLLAVALIALALISWRASVLAAVFIATVLAVTMGVLHLFGISLNTVSLFGVILALGLFVDDAIVITEAIEAFREEADRPLDIIAQAIRRVGSATISGTITTVLVFAPMLVIPGILGEFIVILPTTVIIALLVSLLLSLIFIPVAARFLILGARPSRGLLSSIEAKVGDGLAAFVQQGGLRGGINSLGAVALALVMTGIGLLAFLPRLNINIFPAQKDSIEVEATYGFAPGTTVTEAEAVTARINTEVIELLGGDLVRAYTYDGGARSSTTRFTLTPVGTRTKAPALIDDLLTPYADSVSDADVVFSELSAGPPSSLFPFRLQLFGEDPAVLAPAAEQVAAELAGATIPRANGTSFQVLETRVDRADYVARRDGRRYVEAVARFDADDVSTTTVATRDWVSERFGPEELTALGLNPDAIEYDFGFESQNQESFAALPGAFAVALLAMLALLVIQFRSSVQWLLVFLAIPFSFFGVFGGLLVTDNEISFFVMLGLLGLIGIAVNNTILLVDFANQERRAGADRRTAIATAIRRRFRPLITTSLTTVAGVLPLALADPFWEALGFTIIFGLLSSTFLVVVSFPFFYLGIEWLRDRFVTPWRAGRGRAGSAGSQVSGEAGQGDLVTVGAES